MIPSMSGSSRKITSRLALLSGSALIGWSLIAAPAYAQASGEIRGKKVDDHSVAPLPVGPNTEQGTGIDAGKIPFVISVDGMVLDGSGEVVASDSAAPARQADRQRRTDIDLNSVDIQIKFDGLETTPLLNISTMPLRRAYQAGEKVEFLATTNYPGFIERSEIRIHRVDEGRFVERPVATIPVGTNARAGWTMPPDEGTTEYSYVLRVYDAKGRFDETAPLTLQRSTKNARPEGYVQAIAPGMGEDRTAVRNIRVYGGSVTIHGSNVPEGYFVEAFGEAIPLDADNRFVVQRILPPGEHEVDVAIQGALKGGGLQFNREINIPENDWFYVALADLTIGKRMGNKDIETVRPGEYDNVYTRGRLAFYLKGKIKGEYLLTAAADTAEDDLERLFRNLGHQNPRHLLRRLDPDDYYPVYGDDSTMVEDAPTNGKFYVRLERGDSQILWGNFKTKIAGTEFMRAERALYGASATYVSPESTEFGERRTQATIYAAQPDTLPQREEFLGTGGSAYFMRRQNIVTGSETLSVEIRDAMTGRVIERRTLRHGEDYRFDYIQGVVILSRPLSSATSAAGPVRDGALGGNQLYLIAQYEFEPVATDLDGYSIGGRAQHWLDDRLRIGVSGLSETTGDADQQAGGIDLRLRHSETTFLDAEIAASRGEGFGLWRSTDGGLSLTGQDKGGNKDRTALAWRLQGQVDLADLSDSGMEGTIGGYYEEKQAGFSTLHEQVNIDRRIWGAHADVRLDTGSRLGLAYDDFSDEEGKIKREGKASISHDIDAQWKISLGTTYTELRSPNAMNPGKAGYKAGYNGSRLDAGMRVDYRHDEDHLYYAFGQATLSRSRDIFRNDRAGVGAQIRLTEKIGAEGEISYGTHGLGALAGLTYDPTADDHYYIGYRLDPDRAYDFNRYDDLVGSDRGVLVGGIKRRMGDTLSSYTESSYDLFGKRRNLTQTYGVIYTPDPVWSVNAGLEVGRISDDRIIPGNGQEYSDFDRYAPSLSIGFKDEELGITAHARGEVRVERSDDGSRDQNTYLMALGLGWQTSEDWRAMVSLDGVLSDTRAGVISYQDTDYVEASLGFAYRPVDNDRLNALFRYSWLYDLPGNGQLVSGATDNLFAPAQRSHILSADFTYDLVPWLSVGGKYGFRIGDVKYRPDPYSQAFPDEWQRSSAHLGIVRLDLHLIKRWDLLLEGRVMHMPEADTIDYGALVAVYRHVGNNFKIGAGYNFGRFSDDLRDLTLDDRGVFLNLVGKY